MTKTQYTSDSPIEKQRQLIFWTFRLLIASSIIVEILSNRWPILYLNFFVLLLTFVPFLIKRFFTITLPLRIEILFLASLLLTTFLEKIYAGLLVQFILGLFFGLIGIPLMYVLYSNSRLQFSNQLIVLFSFSFSVTAGTLWEVFRYALISILDINFGILDVDYTPRGLIFTILGALVVSVIGYIDIHFTGGKAFSKTISAFIKKNPKLFIDYQSTPEYILELIKIGESEKLEFKSTLRKNLHTNQFDKKVEHAVLKTITAFLNSDGGTLLVGVGDDGSLIGIETDGFQNTDRFYQHYSNLMKQYIGNEFLPFIKSSILQIKEKNILKIVCIPSSKGVFLKQPDDEEFFIRSGPASVRLKGSKLIQYVDQRFKKD